MPVTLVERFHSKIVQDLEGEALWQQLQYAAQKQRDKIDKTLFELFEPYLRKKGIKGEITRGKVKWRGIKLAHKMENAKEYYQLRQRGKNISPVFIVDYGEMEISYNANCLDF